MSVEMGTDQATTTAITSKEMARRLIQIAWRWLAVFAGATFTALFIYRTVESNDHSVVELVTTGVAMATLVTYIGDVIAAIRGCARYLESMEASLSSVSTPLWKSWASLTTLFLMGMAYTGPQLDKTEPWMIVYSDVIPVDKRLVTIPVLYKTNAVPTKWTKEPTNEWKADGWDTGVSFNNDQLDVPTSSLERIVAAHNACGSPKDAPPVQLEIVGYSSSADFYQDDKTTRLAHSNRLNTEVANRRASNAYCFVAEKANVQLAEYKKRPGVVAATPRCDKAKNVSEGQRAAIIVTLTQWSEDEAGFAAMTNARQLIDRPPGLAENERDSEELTRRVDLMVMHFGACQRYAMSSNRPDTTLPTIAQR